MLENPAIRDLFIYGVVVLFLIIGLVLLMKMLGSVVGSKVREIKPDMMTFDDLGKMQQTGLLTEEEFKRIKARMAEKMLEQTVRPAEPSSDLSGESALRKILMGIEQKGIEKTVESKPVAEPHQAPAAPTLPPEPNAFSDVIPQNVSKPETRLSDSQSKQLFDLEKLLASGAIDQAEYNRLRDYFLKKSGQ